MQKSGKSHKTIISAIAALFVGYYASSIYCRLAEGSACNVWGNEGQQAASSAANLLPLDKAAEIERPQ